MKNDNVHSMLLLLVGGYLLYIAYHLFENLQSGSQDMSRTAFILLIALFALVGCGVLAYAYVIWRNGKKKKDGGNTDHPTGEK